MVYSLTVPCMNTFQHLDCNLVSKQECLQHSALEPRRILLQITWMKVHLFFACFLGASKAFVLVNYDLFSTESDFPVHLTRFLLSQYKDQWMSVRWTTSLSDSFTISNSICQGGVLSLILFTICIDDLLSDFRNLSVGCFWDSHFAGALGYADDEVLVVPSPAALEDDAMLLQRICEQTQPSV